MSPDCRMRLIFAGWARQARFVSEGASKVQLVIPLSRDIVTGWRMGSYDVSDESPERRFRTLFISDIHLGARGSQADKLLDFLRAHDADTIYLVGDIVDGWALKSGWHWPQSHNDFVQKMLRKVRKGAKVVYIPGNHDEFLRSYYGTHFGGIEVVETATHEGADGKKYLVIHGDIFDLVVQNARWLAHLGDKAYDFAIQMNRLDDKSLGSGLPVGAFQVIWRPPTPGRPRRGFSSIMPKISAMPVPKTRQSTLRPKTSISPPD